MPAFDVDRCPPVQEPDTKTAAGLCGDLFPGDIDRIDPAAVEVYFILTVIPVPASRQKHRNGERERHTGTFVSMP